MAAINGLNRKQFEARRQFYRDSDYGIYHCAREVCNTNFDKQQIKLAYNLHTTGRAACAASHGVGKSRFAVCAAIHFLISYQNSKVNMTAPTMHQSKDVLMTEMSMVHNQSAVMRTMIDMKAMSFSVKRNDANSPAFWMGVTVPSSNAVSLQGMHRDNQCWILDESSGISDVAQQTVLGSSTKSAKNNRILAIGNPNMNTGWFFDIFQNPQKWTTMHMNGYDSDFVSQEYIDEMLERYGENSNVFKVRVLGQFPDSDPDAVIPYSDISAAMYRARPKKYQGMVQFGLDVAMAGKNLTCLCIRKGCDVLEFRYEEKSDPDSVLKMVSDAFLEYRAKGMSPHLIVIDKPGVGHAPYYYIKKFVNQYSCEHEVQVHGFEGNKKAFDKTYANRRTESYFRLRNYYIGNMSFPHDTPDWHQIKNDVSGGLAVQRFSINSDGQVAIPLKQTLLTAPMKDDSITSVGYLDFGDAIALAFYMPLAIEDDKRSANEHRNRLLERRQ